MCHTSAVSSKSNLFFNPLPFIEDITQIVLIFIQYSLLIHLSTYIIIQVYLINIFVMFDIPISTLRNWEQEMHIPPAYVVNTKIFGEITLKEMETRVDQLEYLGV